MACCAARTAADLKPLLAEDVDLPTVKQLVVTDGTYTLPMASLLPEEQLVLTLCLRRYG